MIRTDKGLPNTCSQCGREPGTTWFARHDDAARSGQAVCASCAGVVTGAATGEQVVVTDSLADIKGIGPGRAEQLAGMRITTFQQLAEADAETLAKAFGMKTAVVKGWQTKARNALN